MNVTLQATPRADQFPPADTHQVLNQASPCSGYNAFTGDVVLHFQGVVQPPVVGFGPDDKSIIGAHQSGGDAHGGTRFSQAPVQDIGNTQGFCDVGDRNLLTLEIEGGRRGRYP